MASFASVLFTHGLAPLARRLSRLPFTCSNYGFVRLHALEVLEGEPETDE